MPGDAQAIRAAAKSSGLLNANTPRRAVTANTTEGRQLAGTVFGFACCDIASGSNATVARLQNCHGSRVAPIDVIYAAALI